MNPPSCLAAREPNAPWPTDATAVALDSIAAERRAPFRRTPGSVAVAIDPREHPQSNAHRPTTPRSSPATRANDPTGPVVSRLLRPLPTPADFHNASRSEATSLRKASTPVTLPANDAPTVPP